MRRRGAVEWRSAIVHEERKEFFRGKDMLRYFEANPEKLDGISETGMASEWCIYFMCTCVSQVKMHVWRWPSAFSPFSRDG